MQKRRAIRDLREARTLQCGLVVISPFLKSVLLGISFGVLIIPAWGAVSGQFGFVPGITGGVIGGLVGGAVWGVGNRVGERARW